jgi:hypothetical protein
VKIVTANRLTDGVVVYRDAREGWTREISEAQRFSPEVAAAALAEAQAQSRVVVGAYLVEIDDGAFVRRERQRETIRANGPSVGNSLVKKPFPLDGGRVGMGVFTPPPTGVAHEAATPPETFASSSRAHPQPCPSPLEGEGFISGPA